MSDKREYRNFELARDQPERDAAEGGAEGYATVFDTPYLLYTCGTEYWERISSQAFDGADISNVILLYDHYGKILARTTNGTLRLSVDKHGLLVRADLTKSNAAKDLYEEIRNGLITQMSIAFTVGKDCYEELDKGKKVMRTIERIETVYDVSAVAYPANDATSISARAANADDVARAYMMRKRARIAQLRIKIEV